MSDPYRARGVEAPLAFDERPSRRRGGPAPVTLIISLLFLAVAIGVVFMLYRNGTRGPSDAPEPVGAPISDVRSVAPPQPRAADPAAGLSIYRADPAVEAPPAFVAPPEQPDTPTATTQPAAAPPATTAPSAAPGAAKPTPTAATPLAAKTVTAKPTSIDSLLADASATPASRPVTAKAPLPPTGAQTASKAAAPAKTPATTATGAGAIQVQIGAYSSQSLADAGWEEAAGSAPIQMTGKGKKVVPVTKADGSTLYRTSITGFGSKEEAQAVCDRLKAAGKTCFVR